MKKVLLLTLFLNALTTIAQNNTDDPEPFGIEFVSIPKGSFMIGSPASEDGRFDSESPQKKITFTAGFWMSKYEITQRQYYLATGKSPSFFSDCSKCPVEQVSFADAMAFVERLNQQRDGYYYSLPTEAEWEYAARAGTTTPFHFGTTLGSHQANFNGGFPYGLNYGGPNLEKTVTVGSYKPNAWGLYDMHGNVKEWTLDLHSKENLKHTPTDGSANTSLGNFTTRIIRSSSFSDMGRVVRSANRSYSEMNAKYKTLGIRVVARLKSEATSNTRNIDTFSKNGFASFFVVKAGEKKYGIIDRNAREILPPIYERAGEVQGVFKFITAKAAGIADFTGKIIIEPTFYDVSVPIPGVYLAYNRAASTKENISDWALFDAEGKAILPRGSYSKMNVLADGTLRVDHQGITYIIGQKGVIISPKNKKDEVTTQPSPENEEIKKWSDYIRQNPKDPEGYLQRGIAYYNINNYTAALADLTMSIKINPEYLTGNASYWRAEIHFKQAKYELALSDINQCIKLETTYSRALPDLLVFRAKTYCKLGLKIAAKEDEKKVIDLGGEVSEPCK